MRPLDVVIPWTERTDRCRDNLTGTVDRLQIMLSKWDGRIYIIETGKRSGFGLSGVQWHYLGGQPNRSWAANYGFRQTDADIMALLDSDMLLRTGAFNYAIEQRKLHRLGGKLSRGFRDLTAEESEVIIAESRWGGALDSYHCESQHVRGGGRCAGAFWVSRELYTRVRGMCETFHPTGAEDLDMACRIKAASAPHQWGPSLPAAALHLYHDRNRNERNWQKPLTDWVCSRTPDQLKEYIQNLPEDFGSPSGPQGYWPPELEDTRPETTDADD